MAPVWTLGLMTGTVLDGNIDVALLRTDGGSEIDFGAYTLAPYRQEIRELLSTCLSEARTWGFVGPEPKIFAEAEEHITRAQSQAVRALVADAGLTMEQIAAVGFHGQTVLHQAPAEGRLGQTRQLGNGELMAQILKTRVVYDFRSADMAAGGQGAPLSAVYHGALLNQLRSDARTAVLNLGGVANVTTRDASGHLVAFDTGPANAPINDFVAQLGLGEMDQDGALAAAGRVDEARLLAQLDHPYLTRPIPKSLDRFDFGYEWALDMSPEDGAATLTAFTASAVGRALDLLPVRPDRLIVCGGGRHNPTMLKMLSTYAGVVAEKAEAVGWQGDAIEAQCFAYLAQRRLRKLPASFPLTTGVPEPMIAGRVTAEP